MIILLASNWWTVALRGLVSVLFGVAVFVWPGLALIHLILLFGVYAIADGTLALAAAIIGRARGLLALALLAEGLLGLGLGSLALLRPGMTALTLRDLTAAWAVATGALQIAAAVSFHAEFQDDWILVLVGALSIGFGLAMIVEPEAGALAFIWLIGANALVFGLFQLVLAIRLRAWVRQFRSSRPASQRAGTRSSPTWIRRLKRRFGRTTPSLRRRNCSLRSPKVPDRSAQRNAASR